MVTFILSRNVHRAVRALSVFVLVALVLVPTVGSAVETCSVVPPHSDECSLHACCVSGLPAERVEGVRQDPSVWTLTFRPVKLPVVEPDPSEYPPRV